MKKLLSLLCLLLVCLCGFAACDEQKAPNRDSNAPNAEQAPDENKHTHAWGSWSITVAATCGASGEEKRTCSCGEFEIQEIAATGMHNYDTNNKCTKCAFLLQYTQGLAYELNADSASYLVTGGGTATAESIVIPPYYKNKPVTAIKDLAFKDTDNHYIKSVYIPSTVTELSIMAFYLCNNLESIVVDKGNLKYHSSGNCLIDTENKMLIKGCSTSVIPADGSVIIIGAFAFMSDKNLTEIDIPFGIVFIVSQAFWGCEDLSRITIPPSVEIIGSSAFYGTKVIEEHNGVYYVGDWVVDAQETISNVELRPNTRGIASKSFFACRDLMYIKIPASVIGIGEGTFQGCNALECIIFEEKSGWKVWDLNSFDMVTGKNGIEISANIFENATETIYYLTNMYKEYVWKRIV